MLKDVYSQSCDSCDSARADESECLIQLRRPWLGVKPATCWPEPIGIGSSFNASLFEALGELTSTEGRGLQTGHGNTYWAPNVNSKS